MGEYQDMDLSLRVPIFLDEAISTCDQIGPIAGCVEDCAILLEAIAGIDPKDSTSFDMPITQYFHKYFICV